MQRRGLAVFCILAIILSCISFVNAQSVPVVPSPVRDQDAGAIYPNVATDPAYKWSFAQSHSDAELAASGITIIDNDIAYARGQVKISEKDCSNMGGVWCTYANDDRNALQNMIDVQAQQVNNPAPSVNFGPISDLTNIISSAYAQLVAIAKGIFRWEQA